jgi:hypothetical protein
MPTDEVPPLNRAQAEAAGLIESRLASLVAMVTRLEARVATLEGAVAAGQLPVAPLSPAASLPAVALPTEALPNPVHLMGLIGRTCLILGGATFIRALVDAETIHRGWGMALGLSYAVTWILLADRAKAPLDAAFHALASILIAYPLLVESTVRFGILTPGLAGLLLLAVTCLHGAVAWRRDLQPIFWIASLASLGAGFAMMLGCRAIEPFLMAFLVQGVGSLWLTQGRRWQGLRWPTALAANLGVLILTSLAAWPGGPPEAYRGISPSLAMVIALTLCVVYIGTFAVWMLQRRCVMTAFGTIQTILVLLVGVGGALRVALAIGAGVGLLGAGVSLAGLGCYAAAVPFADDQEDTRANFNFFTFLALTLLLLGGAILLPLYFLAPLCGVLGLGAMLAGLHLKRPVLVLQSGFYHVAAFVASGYAAWSFRAFLHSAGPTSAPPVSGLLAWSGLAITLAWFLLRRPTEPLLSRVRPVILALGAMTAVGFGSLLIGTCCTVLASDKADAGLLAVVRTAVLAALAIALAWSGRRLPVLNLRWLVYPLLIVTALKFLFEDLAVGRPLTLFLGFTCFGITLMLAPRLLKTPIPPEGGGDQHPSTPEVHP